MRRAGVVVILVSFMVFSFSVLSFAQEEQSNQPITDSQKESIVASEVPSALGNSEFSLSGKPFSSEWLYGEVNSVDIVNKSIVLTYLDYDADIEKQITVYVDAKTVFENVKSLGEIKPQDMVSVDYTAGANGNNTALSISVEKIGDIEDFKRGPQVPAAGEAEIKPNEQSPSMSAQENPASPDLSAEPFQAR